MSRSRSSSSQSSTNQKSRRRSTSRKRDRRYSSASSHEERDQSRNRNSKTKPPPKTRCLGVFGLNGSTTEEQIKGIFQKFGKIKRINVIFDTKTGRSRGFCFVYFKHLRDAIDAKEKCSGMEIDYRRIRVDYSITRRPHEPTPGVYKGQSTRRESDSRSTRRRTSYSPDYDTRRGRYRSRSR